jgi:flagellar biosynthesis protein FlhF
MQAKRFIAADMRRALDMVKEEFGDDAMIISTERTSKGVELVASAEEPIHYPHAESHLYQKPVSEHQQKIANAASRFKSLETPSVPLDTAVKKSTARHGGLGLRSDSGSVSGKTANQLAEEMELANRKMLAARKANSMTLETWADQQTTSRSSRASSVKENTMDHSSHQTVGDHSTSDKQDIRRLYNEIAEMRQTLELQLAHMADSQERQYSESLAHTAAAALDNSMPVVSEIKYQLEVLGLPKACNDQLIMSIKDNNMPIANKSLLWTHVLAELSRRIPSDSSDPVAKGGVYAFLGTTGVGKTTTIAKLAARYVMQHGAEGVVILTTDTYRIASHNQLRSLGKILNVKVQVVEDLAQLPTHLAELKHHPLVLIDTPGMGYADPLLKSHLGILKQSEAVKNILVLSANSQSQMMKASLHSYRLAGLAYCVLTKLDECANLGDAMGVLFEQDLALAYVTDGQSVPEDIAVHNAAQLVTRAVNMLKSQRKSKMAIQQSV